VVAKKKKIEHIGIIGRRWFEKRNGNTYHTAEIFVNGRKVHKLGVSYGGGSMYEQNAVEWLKANGYFPKDASPILWHVAQDMGFTKDSGAIDVPRKKDL